MCCIGQNHIFSARTVEWFFESPSTSPRVVLAYERGEPEPRDARNDPRHQRKAEIGQVLEVLPEQVIDDGFGVFLV